jgi:hypothetical protein
MGAFLPRSFSLVVDEKKVAGDKFYIGNEKRRDILTKIISAFEQISLNGGIILRVNPGEEFPRQDRQSTAWAKKKRDKKSKLGKNGHTH